MCGFAGLIHLDGSSCAPEPLTRMASVLVHRGPDDEGFHFDGPVGFAFRRLAIIDLSICGHQPMQFGDGRFTIVYNGEIYNYLELREQLEARGHRFRSRSDTEVLLAAYAEWGRDCLPRLNGMWAFLIYDRERRVVFGSRDRFGMKPLFRARAGGRMLFGSEIKALRASGIVATAPNMALVRDLLVTGRMERVLPAGKTFFVGIDEVPAASGFELSLDGSWREWRFWSPSMQTDAAPVEPQEMYAALEASVDRHLRADVRVGVSLSGGLDSTLVASLLARSRRDRAEAVRAFSYITPEFDERPYIDDVVDRYGVVLDTRDTNGREAFEHLPRVLWHNDEPIHSLNASIGLEIYGAAADGDVKVMMSGQGADELLAGYPSGFPILWSSLIRRGRLADARDEMQRYVAVHGGDPAQLFRHAARAAVAGAVNTLPGLRTVARLRRSRRPVAPGTICSQALLAAATGGGDARPVSRTLAEQLESEIADTPLPLYLRVEDRVSMAQSVESRLPFLDADVAALAARLPDSARISGPWNKALLREATRGLLPDSIRTRPVKFGFPIPVGTWIRTILRDDFRRVIESDAVRQRGIYDVARVRDRFERHLRGEVDASNELFNVVQLECWFEHVVGADYATTPQFSPRRTAVAAAG